jgi:hypothetical protein
VPSVHTSDDEEHKDEEDEDEMDEDEENMEGETLKVCCSINFS